MATQDFSIQITLAGDAAQTLVQNGFRLYACQAQDTNILVGRQSGTPPPRFPP